MNCLLKMWEKCLFLDSGIMAIVSLPLTFTNAALLSLKRGASENEISKFNVNISAAMLSLLCWIRGFNLYRHLANIFFFFFLNLEKLKQNIMRTS